MKTRLAYAGFALAIFFAAPANAALTFTVTGDYVNVLDPSDTHHVDVVMQFDQATLFPGLPGQFPAVDSQGSTTSFRIDGVEGAASDSSANYFYTEKDHSEFEISGVSGTIFGSMWLLSIDYSPTPFPDIGSQSFFDALNPSGNELLSLSSQYKLAGNFSLTVSGTPPTPEPEVPEPASWAMMLLGLGLVGGILRQRKTSVAFS